MSIQPHIATWARSVAIVVVLGVVSCRNVTAQELTVAPADRSLDVRVIFDGKNTSISRYVSVTTDKAVQQVALDPGDLVSTTGEVVDRSNVRLAQAASLTPSIPTNLLVNISGIAKPGIYSGAFILRPADKPPNNSGKVDLKLSVEPKPTVSFLPQAPTLYAVGCSVGLSCWFGQWLASVSATQTIALNNETQGRVTLKGASLYFRGEKSGQFLDTTELAVTVPKADLVQNALGKIEVVAKSDRLAADKYQGVLRLNVQDLDGPITATASLYVRDGAGLAVILLLAGILAGRIARVVNAPEYVARMRQLHTLDIFTKASEEIHYDLIKDKIDKARLSIRLANSIESVDKQLDSLSTTIQILSSLQAARTEAARMGDSGVESAARNAESEILADLNSEKFQEAQGKLTNLQNVLISAQQAAQQQKGGSGLQAQILIGLLRTAIPVVPSSASSTSKFERFLLKVSGGAPVDPGFGLWKIGGPLSFILLLLLLVMVGTYTLYIKNPTFGSDAFYDYLGVFLWGLSADVAQRSLQNIALPH